MVNKDEYIRDIKRWIMAYPWNLG